MKRATLAPVALSAVIVAGCGEPGGTRQTAERAGSQEVDPITLVRNGKMPFAGVLTGGQPTDEQLAALREAGFATVINLRRPDERGTRGEAEKVAALGMTYVSLPVDGASGLSEENAAALAAALEGAARPVLVHCGSSNRVGALLALKAFWLDGASPDEALAIGRSAGLTRMESTVREILGRVD